MDKSSILRTFIGVAIVIFGVTLLLHNLNIIQFHYWRELWCGTGAVGLCVAGLVLLIDKIHTIWGVLLIILGATLFLRVSGVVDVQLWGVVVPAVIIGIGLQTVFCLFGKQKGCNMSKNSKRLNNTGAFRADAFLSSNELVETGKYKGGRVSAVLGGVDIDLRKADIVDGSVIEVFSFCGGIKIMLPDDVVVDNRSMCILGGIDNKTNSSSHAKKTIHVDGIVLLGDMEIR